MPDHSQSTSSDTPPTAPTRNRKAGRRRILIFSLLGLIAAGWGAHLIVRMYHFETTDDAYVVGFLHRIGPQVDGVVKEVLVDENQTVKAGDLLVRLDPLEFEISLQKAEANLAAAKARQAQATAALAQNKAQVEKSRAEALQAQGELKQAQSRQELSELTLNRNQQLFQSGGAVTTAEVDNARTAAAADRAAVDAAQANLSAADAAVDAAIAGKTAIVAQIDGAKAEVDAADAARREAQRQLDCTRIVAPTDGRIGNRNVETGDRVQAGQALLALVEPHAWIEANFKETQLSRIEVGQPVDLAIDALPGLKLSGTVESVAPASGAQYALLPPDNATGNFNKVVQRVPVRIQLDADSTKQVGDHLRLGLSVVVSVHVR